MQVSAATFAQKVTLQKSKASLKEVFEQINLQTGYDVIWKSEQLKNAKTINANFKDKEVKELLDEVLPNQGLGYTITDKTIVIKVKEASFLERLVDRIMAIDVRGRVVDEKGEPLIGATVKGLALSTSTDKDGNFFLQNVSEDAVLEISYIGYMTKTVKAGKDVGTIRLEMATSDLQEVKINKGYYTESKRLSTASVVTVKAEDIAKQPISNPLQALQGRMAGVYIQQESGNPGASFNIKIRGQNSLRGKFDPLGDGNLPLYVIDGVPYNSSSIAGLAAMNGRANPLNSINPYDIETIDILKDADATAIYGSRGSNGVVLITTKRGKEGKTVIDANVWTGVGEVGHFMDLLNRRQYLDLRYKAFKNSDIIPDPNNARDLVLWDTTRTTDWQKELIGGKANYTNAQLSFSGGNQNTQFITRGSYSKETTVFPGSLGQNRIALHSNLSHRSTDQRFSLSLTSDLSNINDNLIYGDYTTAALTLIPTAPAIYNSDGDFNWETDQDGLETWTNPIASYGGTKANNKTLSSITNINMSYKVASGTEIKISGGYTLTDLDQHQITPLSSYNPKSPYFQYSTGYASHSDNKIRTWIVEPSINYSKAVGKGVFTGLIGSTFQSTNLNQLAINASGYTDDDLINDLAAATSLYVLMHATSQYKYFAVLSRLGYSYDNKYVFNLTGRRDGSSRFGENKQYGNFGSVGVAWVFSNEDYFKDSKILSSGKLRGSYGVDGSDQIGNYGYLNSYNVTSPYNYQDIKGLRPTRLANSDFSWEETKKLNLALEVGLLKGSLLATVEYYQNRSSNQLIGYSLPSTTGFSTIQANFPATVENSGAEVSLEATIVRKSNFQWTTNFNISFPKNKLVEFKNLSTSSYKNKYVVGKPLEIFKSMTGVAVNPSTGLYTYNDLNGNGYGDQEDATQVHSLGQKYHGGLQNSITYKNLSFDWLIQFVNQKGRDNSRNLSAPGSYYQNESTEVLSHWEKPGDISNRQKIGIDYIPYGQAYGNIQYYSPLSIRDASFIRLKNVSISYDLKSVLGKRFDLSRSRLYVQGQNIFTSTKWKGLDPESISYNSLPPLRLITIGLQITL